MPKSVRKGTYKFNRKKVFKYEDLQMWLSTREGRVGEFPQAILELQQRRPDTRTQWELFWSGTVIVDAGGVTVQTNSLRRDKSN